MAEPEPPLGWGELQDPHPGQPSVLPSCSGGGCRGDGTKHLPTPGIRPCISTPFLPGLQTTPSANTPPPHPRKGDFSTITHTALLCLANGFRPSTSCRRRHLSGRAPCGVPRTPHPQHRRCRDPQSSSPAPSLCPGKPLLQSSVRSPGPLSRHGLPPTAARGLGRVYKPVIKDNEQGRR